MSKTSYTAVGFIAVLLWALLALFTVGSAPVPPFLLNALCFAIGGGIGVIWLLATGGLSQLRRVPLRVYLIGTAGLFGYHFLYFSALRMAPAAEAGLIAYLWPLLIVLFSGLLPGEHLKRGHIIGGLIGFAGAVLIVAQGVTGFNADALPGYGLAFLCALTWSGYSVVSRSFGAVPTASVVVFCLATAILSGVAHVALEDTIWPTTTLGWLSVIGLGVGPVGIAFFVWDVGVKKGDIQLLGVASYAAPVLSTLALVVAGIAAPTWTLLLAAALITGGAALAAQASRRP
ncbi:aromatic amino acid exporter YddG [Marivivens donghaensis]|uniref:aromatic amino acid exporter YddG n=1 Tax=Marivivens donghaensis TaxID=1699413 RepID=UPI00201E8519|nr:EamA family transporter [Marivivens donghaensis]MCL7408530.1 EamA family transporter [Marivivens donghaensis]MDN3704699.1 EamA family transporter [Marivivens donghaensis]